MTVKEYIVTDIREATTAYTVDRTTQGQHLVVNDGDILEVVEKH
jgi:hypothetical protein